MVLTVPAPAVISAQPIDPGSAVPVGTFESFSVTAALPAECPCATSPPFTYQWRLNGVDITGATDSSYT